MQNLDVKNSPLERGVAAKRTGCVIHQIVEKFIPSSVIFSKVFILNIDLTFNEP
jgi:hypothetical protein